MTGGSGLASCAPHRDAPAAVVGRTCLHDRAHHEWTYELDGCDDDGDGIEAHGEEVILPPCSRPPCTELHIVQCCTPDHHLVGTRWKGKARSRSTQVTAGLRSYGGAWKSYLMLTVWVKMPAYSDLAEPHTCCIWSPLTT